MRLDPVAVLARANLLALIGAHVELRRSGTVYWGRCPFHDERTSSFQVRTEKGTWRCFGCGAAGNAINFVQQRYGIGFREACERLSPGCTDRPSRPMSRDWQIMNDSHLERDALASFDRAYADYMLRWPMSALPKEMG